jgi:hypothetical protein
VQAGRRPTGGRSRGGLELTFVLRWKAEAREAGVVESSLRSSLPQLGGLASSTSLASLLSPGSGVANVCTWLRKGILPTSGRDLVVVGFLSVARRCFVRIGLTSHE